MKQFVLVTKLYVLGKRREYSRETTSLLLYAKGILTKITQYTISGALKRERVNFGKTGGGKIPGKIPGKIRNLI